MEKKKNRKVPCIGCAKDVNRSDAEFCLLDGMYCYFCKDCLRKIQKKTLRKRRTRERKKEKVITEIPKAMSTQSVAGRQKRPKLAKTSI